MKISSIHLQLEHETSHQLATAVVHNVALIADELEKIYDMAKRLNFTIVTSNRMQEAVVFVQDCALCSVAFPALSDNALLAVHSVSGDHATAEYVRAQCFIKISTTHSVRVLNSLSDTTSETMAYDAREIAKRVCRLLTTYRRERDNWR